MSSCSDQPASTLHSVLVSTAIWQKCTSRGRGGGGGGGFLHEVWTRVSSFLQIHLHLLVHCCADACGCMSLSSCMQGLFWMFLTQSRPNSWRFCSTTSFSRATRCRMPSFCRIMSWLGSWAPISRNSRLIAFSMTSCLVCIEHGIRVHD